MEPQTKLSMIVAAGQNNVIGHDGVMPWHLRSDLAHFKRVSSGKPVLMGRKTWASLFVQPLPGRDNLVLSRNTDFVAEGAKVFNDLNEMIAHARGLDTDEVIIIGGETLYRAALPLCDRVYLTRVDASPKGDTFFPQLAETDWRLVSQQPYPAGDKDDHAFVCQVFERALSVPGLDPGSRAR